MSKIILEASMVGDTLQLKFEDGTRRTFSDNAQSCCEDRYMTCDDDLPSFKGDEYLGFEVLDGPDIEGGECHETAFLHVRTSGGTITCQTHNEHNGYYGGFNVVSEEYPQ